MIRGIFSLSRQQKALETDTIPPFNFSDLDWHIQCPNKHIIYRVGVKK